MALMLILSASSAMALKSDRDQPADIEADDTVIDFRTGQRTFTGNVIVVQGTLRIKADRVVANYKDGELVNATAIGRRARFKSRPDGKPDDVEGLARTIFVNQRNNTLTLTGQAMLQQGLNTANGEEIIYNMNNDTLKINKGSRIGAGGNTGKVRPNRKLKDPFADDPEPTVGKTAASKKSSGKSGSAASNTKQAKTTTTQTSSGRSRLLIQPKPKKDATKKQGDKK